MNPSSQKNISVTVGIPAYNEESNIQTLLKAIVAQKEKRITITEILVYSDGSSDDTVTLARSIPDPRIHVHACAIRHGKTFRLNQIFKKMTGDVLVLFDADVVPATSDAIEKLCQPFLNSGFRGLTGSNRKAIPSHSLTGIALGQLNDAYGIIRNQLNEGKNLYGFLAGMTALHKDFAHTLKLPIDCNADDNYVFLEAKQRKLPVQYVHSAVNLYIPPQSIRDQISQGSRFLCSASVLERYFDKTFIYQEYFIPSALRWKVFLYQMQRNPVAQIWLKLLGVMCTIQSRKIAHVQGSIWDIVTSTKGKPAARTTQRAYESASLKHQLGAFISTSIANSKFLSANTHRLHHIHPSLHPHVFTVLRHTLRI
jgi:glycosyltransferase involved in cell wall biosynthesis